MLVVAAVAIATGSSQSLSVHGSPGARGRLPSSWGPSMLNIHPSLLSNHNSYSDLGSACIVKKTLADSMKSSLHKVEDII